MKKRSYISNTLSIGVVKRDLAVPTQKTVIDAKFTFALFLQGMTEFASKYLEL